MGSSQSTGTASSTSSTAVLGSEIAVTGLIILAGVWIWRNQGFNIPSDSKTEEAATPFGVTEGGKTKNKKKGAKKDKKVYGGLDSSIDTLVPESSGDEGIASTSKTPVKSPLSSSITTITPARTDSPPLTSTASAASKNKKKKKAATSLAAPPPLTVSAVSLGGGISSSASTGESEDGWTKVGRDVQASQPVPAGKGKGAAQKQGDEEEKKTFAEKMLPKPVPTAVDDMLAPAPPLARVMRVVDPEDPEAEAARQAQSLSTQIPPGFSLGDYEDAKDLTSANEQDDDEGWGVVPVRKRNAQSTSSRSATPTNSKPSQPTAAETKKQRQNAARREAEKQQKSDAEKERLAKLAKHKRELENERMKAQFARGSGSKGPALSGGMKASVDEKGNLVWE